jgi:hypothetical protein
VGRVRPGALKGCSLSGSPAVDWRFEDAGDLGEVNISGFGEGSPL